VKREDSAAENPTIICHTLSKAQQQHSRKHNY